MTTKEYRQFLLEEAYATGRLAFLMGSTVKDLLGDLSFTVAESMMHLAGYIDAQREKYLEDKDYMRKIR